MSAAAAPRGAWARHAALLRQPWQGRRNRRSWLSMLLVPLLAMAVAVLMAMPVSAALRLGAGVVLATGGLVLLVILWWVQVDGLLRQNRHTLACLVPGHAQALQRSLVVQGLLVTAVAVLLLSLATSLQLRWLWLCLVAVVMLAWLVREPMGWIAFALGWSYLEELPRGAQQLAALPWGVQLLGLGTLVLLLAACAGQGGRWHRWVDTRQRRWQRATDAMSQGEAVPAAGQGRPLRAVTAFFEWPQRLWRRRVIAAGPRQPIVPRLELALNTGGTWAALLWLGGCGLAALGLLMATQQAVSWSALAEAGRFGLCIGLFSMLGGVLNGRLERLWSRRREQALMLLLPGCPRGDGLALLEVHGRRAALLLWAALTALALGLTLPGGAASQGYVLCVALLCLPMPWVACWRARRLQGKPSPWVFGLWPLLAALGGVAATALGLTVGPLGLTVAWASGVALALAAAAELLVRRDPAPVLPLPAGRGGGAGNAANAVNAANSATSGKADQAV